MKVQDGNAMTSGVETRESAKREGARQEGVYNINVTTVYSNV